MKGIEHDTDDITGQFWVDPDGKVYKWKSKKWRGLGNYYSIHTAIAYKILRKVKNPGDVLFNLGWIIVNSSTTGNLIKKDPTQAQLNTMFDLGYKSIDVVGDRRIQLRK